MWDLSKCNEHLEAVIAKVKRCAVNKYLIQCILFLISHLYFKLEINRQGFY